jgi:hypothetical protein
MVIDAPASRFTCWMGIRQAPEVKDKRADDAGMPWTCQGKHYKHCKRLILNCAT